jgi:hypothetical protein
MVFASISAIVFSITGICMLVPYAPFNQQNIGAGLCLIIFSVIMLITSYILMLLKADIYGFVEDEESQLLTD